MPGSIYGGMGVVNGWGRVCRAIARSVPGTNSVRGELVEPLAATLQQDQDERRGEQFDDFAIALGGAYLNRAIAIENP